MLKTRTLAFISVTTGILSIICLLLVMKALQEIYYGTEPSLTAEWNMVRVGLPVFLFFHVLSLAGILNLLRTWRKRS